MLARGWLLATFAAVSTPRTQRQNECACSADLWFERQSITNAPLQPPNSHLLPQHFFCWIRYVMEEVRRNLSWKRQPYLFWFGLIHAKRKQTMGILKMPPFCRVRLLTGDEHAHSFCRCVDSQESDFMLERTAETRLHDIGMKVSLRYSYRGELAPVWLALVWDFVLVSCKRIKSHKRELEWTRIGMKVAPVSCKHPLTFNHQKLNRFEGFAHGEN